MSRSPPSGGRLFALCAAGALGLHALLLFGDDGLRGGADLRPHLRLVQLMDEAPAIRNVYAPAYHALGALLSPPLDLATYPEVFALASAAALIAAFRAFQRAAALPDAASALFAWTPYLFALSACLPKIEAAGYALALLALASLLRRRRVALAVLGIATAWFHTAAFLFLVVSGGALALARRDRAALLALAAGAAGALPLFGAHLTAGCSLAEAFLFSSGDYLRDAPRARSPAELARIVALAGPIAVGCALFGARRLWRRQRAVALWCLLATVLYANELWLAPFGARTTLDLLRGLTVLAFPIALAGGTALEGRPRAAAWVAAACAAWGLAASFRVVPDACFTRPIQTAGLSRLEVARCTFRWRDPARTAGGHFAVGIAHRAR